MSRIDDPMTPEELLAALEENWEERYSLYPSNAERQGHITDEEQERLAELEREKDQLTARLLARTEVFPRVRFWMVDVCGKCEGSVLPDNEEEAEELLMEAHRRMDPAEAWKGDRKGFADLTGSNLSKIVYDIVAAAKGDLGRMTDSGMGGERWHVGVHCTQNEADSLLAILEVRFKKQIEAGLVWLKRIYWSAEMKEV